MNLTYVVISMLRVLEDVEHRACVSRVTHSNSPPPVHPGSLCIAVHIQLVHHQREWYTVPSRDI
jgi:hypothetical protein